MFQGLGSRPSRADGYRVARGHQSSRISPPLSPPGDNNTVTATRSLVFGALLAARRGHRIRRSILGYRPAVQERGLERRIFQPLLRLCGVPDHRRRRLHRRRRARHGTRLRRRHVHGRHQHDPAQPRVPGRRQSVQRDRFLRGQARARRVRVGVVRVRRGRERDRGDRRSERERRDHRAPSRVRAAARRMPPPMRRVLQGDGGVHHREGRPHVRGHRRRPEIQLHGASHSPKRHSALRWLHQAPLFAPANRPRDICILRLSAIGDTCHSVPVIHALQRAWPECRITWIIGRVESKLMSLVPGVELLTVDKRRFVGRARAAAHRARVAPFRSSPAYAGEPAGEPPEHAGARSHQARIRSGESARVAMAVHEPADRPAPARARPRQLHGIRWTPSASRSIRPVWNLPLPPRCARLRARDHSRHAADVVGERVLEPYAAQLAAGRLCPSVRPRCAAAGTCG